MYLAEVGELCNTSQVPALPDVCDAALHVVRWDCPDALCTTAEETKEVLMQLARCTRLEVKCIEEAHIVAAVSCMLAAAVIGSCVGEGWF